METTREMLVQLVNALTDNYRAQLERLPMKKTVRETLVDGFRDGAREGAFHVCKMLEVTVKE